MPTRHVVVDGSNIATEGRSTPSLDQLESAVTELRKDLPDAEVIVVVDATFAHRIDPGELPRFEADALKGTYVAPPAGAIGRGDAFLLRIAEKVGAMVLSNDSFQEFHGEHPWLFETGRLLGATPVPGVGWIFVPRTPVRGPRSRVAVRDAVRSKNIVQRAIADATKEVNAPEAPSRRSRSRRSNGDSSAVQAPAVATSPAPSPTQSRPAAVNEPLEFISFIAEHPLGATVEGLVEGFTSHGAVILVGSLRCYVPLAGLADPAPRSAREVLRKGERRAFVITALDPNRRGVELAVPGVGVVRGVPTEETVAAELAMSRGSRRRGGQHAVEPVTAEQPPTRRRRASAVPTPAGAPAEVAVPETPRRARAKVEVEEAAVLQAPPTKRPAKVATPAKRAAKKAAPRAASQAGEGVSPPPVKRPAKKAATSSAAPTKRAAKKAPVEKAPVEKAATKRLAAKKATAGKTAAAKKTAAVKSAPAKRAPAKVGR